MLLNSFSKTSRHDRYWQRTLSRIKQIALDERQRWPLWLAVLACLGSASYFYPVNEPAVAPTIALTGINLAGLIMFWKMPAVRWGLAFSLSALIGFSSADLHAHRASPFPSITKSAVIVVARIRAIDNVPSRNGSSHVERLILSDARFETGVDIGMPPLRRTLSLRLREADGATLKSNDVIRVRALFRSIAGPSIPMASDRQRDAWFNGSAGTGTALGTVEVLGGSTTSASYLENLREHIATRLQALLPGDTGAVASTIMTGISGSLSQQVRSNFAASGLSHLLAVAGLHIGIIMMLVMTATRFGLAQWQWPALHWPCKEIAALAALAAGGAYVALTGDHLPAQRSFAMACIAVLAILTGRKPASMRALALAAVIIVTTSPESVLGVSFQMSFAAVMALIAGYDVLRSPLQKLNATGTRSRKILAHIVSLGLTSLLAGSATLPVSIAHFGTIQPFFVLANLLAVPLMGLWIMPLGITTVLAMPFGVDQPIAHLMGIGIDTVIWLAHYVATFPAATITVPATPSWVLLWFMMGLCWLCLWSKRWRYAGILIMLPSLIVPWIHPRPSLLVSSDASMIGFNSRDGLYIGHSGGNNKIIEGDWKQALGISEIVTPKTLIQHDHIAGSSENQEIACDRQACVLKTGSGNILLRIKDASDGKTTISETSCANANLIVSSTPLDDSCPGKPFIDRFSVWRDGSFAVWTTHRGLRILSDRQWRGNRLWVETARNHGLPNLPMATSE